uniref:Apple domain-containing protein n=1 Tax=Parastrongyloides trichosuri TaxID=131310 RepID=A0A0N4ZHI3_PARTI
MKYFSLLLINIAIISIESLINVEKCFEPHFHRAYSNAVPIVELWNIPVTDCLAYCIVNSIECHGVVYHKNFYTCQLYREDQSINNDGKFVFANGHDFFNRTSFIDDCKTKTSDKPPKIIQENIRSHVKNEIFTHAIKTVPVIEKSDILQVNTLEIIASSTTQKPIEIVKEMKNTVVPDSVISPMQILESSEMEDQIFFFNPPISKFVLSEIKFGYFKVSDMTILVIPGDSKKMFNITENDCLRTCSNLNNIEEKKTFCQSVLYHKSKKLCVLLNDDTKEFKKFTRLAAKQDVVFYDKMAMPVNTECRQVTPIFDIYTKKTITKNIIKEYNSIAKLKDCSTLCAINNLCSFASYSRKKCILHKKSESKVDIEDIIENGTQYSAVIANGCI